MNVKRAWLLLPARVVPMRFGRGNGLGSYATLLRSVAAVVARRLATGTGFSRSSTAV